MYLRVIRYSSASEYCEGSKRIPPLAPLNGILPTIILMERLEYVADLFDRQIFFEEFFQRETGKPMLC